MVIPLAAAHDRVQSNAKATVLLLASVLIASAVLPLPGSDGRIMGLPSVCFFYDVTGLPCPGCGLTRSFVCFAHGHFLQAFHWHLLGPPLWLLAAFLLVRATATVVAKREIFPFSQKFITNSSWGMGGAFLIFDIVRIALLTAEHRRF